jgi:F-type H+-transporting ATPase subunit gamma
MADIREISDRMKSIRDTKKITNAMYMISSNKLQKAKKRLENTEPYYYNLQYAMKRILRHLDEDVSDYMRKPVSTPEHRKRAVIVIGGDKGLAGAYNHNITKEAQNFLLTSDSNTVFVFGDLGRQFFKSHQIPYEADFTSNVTNPSLHRARIIAGKVLSLFESEAVEEVWIIYTKMENSLSSKLITEKLLPVERPAEKVDINIHREDLRMEPTPKDVMNYVIPNYVTGYIYCALAEANCSEENARMMAMETAGNNAADLLWDLNVEFNRARQAQITQQITEIIGGAKALNKDSQ